MRTSQFHNSHYLQGEETPNLDWMTGEQHSNWQMMWSDRSGMKCWRWWKAYTFWCVGAPVLMTVMICFDCEVIVPLNGDALRYHQVQQICHTWLPSLWSCPEVCSWCELLLFWWPHSCSCSLLLSQFLSWVCPSHHLQSASQSHSSDLSKDVLLPAATETGCLWLFEELVFSCLLDDESGSTLGLPGLIFGNPRVVGAGCIWARDANDDNLEMERLGAEG